MASDSAGWWVYIPSAGDRLGATKKVAELKTLGVEEYFVVQDEGPNRFAISLGIFKTQEAAQKHLENLRAKGVKTARLGERETQVQKTYFRMKGLAAPVLSRLHDAARNFQGSELRLCGGS